MSTGGDSQGWNVAEEESYVRAVAQAGGFEYIDPIIAPIDYALYRNPLGFQKVPGYQDLYLAKTKLRILGSEVVPSYRLWFRVDLGARTVWKLWVEVAPPEDMGLADDPWGDDDLPL